MCLSRLEADEQEKMHWVQLKGFSPEWERMCVLRLSAREVEKLHCAQHVPLEVASLFAGIIALPAFERILPRVDEEVLF